MKCISVRVGGMGWKEYFARRGCFRQGKMGSLCTREAAVCDLYQKGLKTPGASESGNGDIIVFVGALA